MSRYNRNDQAKTKAEKLRHLKIEAQKTAKRILRSKVMRLMDEKLKTGCRVNTRHQQKRDDIKTSKSRKLVTAYKKYRSEQDRDFRGRPMVHTAVEDYFLRNPEKEAFPRLDTRGTNRFT